MKKLLLILCLAFFSLFHLTAEDINILENLPEDLVLRSGKKVKTTKLLKRKKVALFFASSTNSPSKSFTPQLIKFYKTARKDVEMILVSSEKSQKEMENFMKKYAMPWVAIPHDAQEGNTLKKHFNIKDLPRLILFNEQGKMLCPDARWDILMLGKKALDAWEKADYKPMTKQDFDNKTASETKKDKKSDKKADKKAEKKAEKEKEKKEKEAKKKQKKDKKSDKKSDKKKNKDK